MNNIFNRVFKCKIHRKKLDWLKRLFQIDPDYMMLVAGCAVLFNIILGLVLHGVCRIPHGHSHGSGKHNHIHSGNNNHEHFSNFQSDSESDDDEFEDSLNKRDIENVSSKF